MTDQQNKGLIVVGVDGSDESEAALEWAVEDARRRGARLRVVTGFDYPWTFIFVPAKDEFDYERDAQAMLDRTLEKYRETHADIEFEMRLVPRKPALALVEAARDADLLVVGGHGHGRLQGMHLGSVATYCVHHAPCPVLVHRTQE
ncbi:MAG: universal stress protein [Dermatophilaceae bacterium]|nr:universal stress protein [Intrasporangiaceae bacterium]